MIHGTVLDIMMDRSTLKPVHPFDPTNGLRLKRDTYRRASIAVRQPRSVLLKLIPFASVKGNGTRETSSSMSGGTVMREKKALLELELPRFIQRADQSDQSNPSHRDNQCSRGG